LCNWAAPLASSSGTASFSPARRDDCATRGSRTAATSGSAASGSAALALGTSTVTSGPSRPSTVTPGSDRGVNHVRSSGEAGATARMTSSRRAAPARAASASSSRRSALSFSCPDGTTGGAGRPAGSGSCG